MSRYILWLLFSWRGRIARKTFIFSGLGLITLKNVVTVLFPSPTALLAFIFIVGLWGALALSAKRLHDLGWSAGWLLLNAPILGAVFGLLPQNIEVAGLVGYAELFVFLVVPMALFVVLGLKQGDAAANAYGERTAPPPQFDALGVTPVAVAIRGPAIDGAPRKNFGRRSGA
jgi:uncharacterized membrane protein YhaH (DUF805 family)